MLGGGTLPNSLSLFRFLPLLFSWLLLLRGVHGPDSTAVHAPSWEKFSFLGKLPTRLSDTIGVHPCAQTALASDDRLLALPLSILQRR